MNLTGFGATCLGALATPIAVWVGLQQRNLAEAQLQDAGQIHLDLVRSGIPVSTADRGFFERYELHIGLHGPGSRHGVRVSLQTCNGINYLGDPIIELHAGSVPAVVSFWLHSDEQESAVLGVQWVGRIAGKPMPQMLRMRINDQASVEQWRWRRWALWRRDRYLRRTKRRPKAPSRRLGKWYKQPNLPYSADELPGWPIGRTTKTVGSKPPELRE